MKDGFIKAAGIVPWVFVGDPRKNVQEMTNGLAQALEHGAKIIAFPELAITGYTCQDLFLQDELLRSSEQALLLFCDVLKEYRTDALVFVGFPLEWRGKLYNTAAVLQNGKILAFIPKQFIPNYAEFYEARQFAQGPKEVREISFCGENVPFGSRILFCVDAIPGLLVGCELCEDAWVVNAPHLEHAMAGASVIVNLSASNETVAKDEYRRSLVQSISARTISDYLYVSAGDGESTQDLVFGGRILCYENGSCLAERKCFDNSYGESKICYADLDIQRINYERRRMSTYETWANQDEAKDTHSYQILSVHMEECETKLSRSFDPHPFVPGDARGRKTRCEEIFSIQSRGLAKRLHHTNCDTAVIGVSGGLDSTLALLVVAKAMDLLQKPRSKILAVTMPCFGTTDRTHQNAKMLSHALGATFLEIPIENAVKEHFVEIGQDINCHDVIYENGQARERTQVLMDVANQRNGLVVGTGDLSELALGWATYNGDHMSMYAVNAGVPKTLVSHLVQYCKDNAQEQNPVLSSCLQDILDTPVSPELLPPSENGTISQKTEELVGPYELHDFFLYCLLRCGFRPGKIYRLAVNAFAGIYDEETILSWEKVFIKRFFSQQFKRSCLPDGPKVGSVSLSPRGDWRMPSDAMNDAWMHDLDEFNPDEIKKERGTQHADSLHQNGRMWE